MDDRKDSADVTLADDDQQGITVDKVKSQPTLSSSNIFLNFVFHL